MTLVIFMTGKIMQLNWNAGITSPSRAIEVHRGWAVTTVTDTNVCGQFTICMSFSCPLLPWSHKSPPGGRDDFQLVAGGRCPLHRQRLGSPPWTSEESGLAPWLRQLSCVAWSGHHNCSEPWLLICGQSMMCGLSGKRGWRGSWRGRTRKEEPIRAKQNLLGREPQPSAMPASGF